jgi:hypothetical protein
VPPFGLNALNASVVNNKGNNEAPNAHFFTALPLIKATKLSATGKRIISNKWFIAYAK